MTRLGYQIPNFTYPDTQPHEIFDRVVAQAKAAEAEKNEQREQVRVANLERKIQQEEAREARCEARCEAAMKPALEARAASSAAGVGRSFPSVHASRSAARHWPSADEHAGVSRAASMAARHR